MNETISVIIPTFQHASTIVRCVDSVLAQTRKADEIIVVDDGSTDQTQELLKPYQNRIRVLTQKNQGAPVARNNGFAESTGTFVMFCDADVEMSPNMLLELENALKSNSEASFAYSGFRWGWKSFSSFPFDNLKLKQMNYIHTSALIRRNIFPGFDESLKRFQDWDLWLTIAENGGKGIFVAKELFSVVEEDRPERMSTWLPSLVMLFPWHKIGWVPKRVKKYIDAKAVIVKKHHLENI